MSQQSSRFFATRKGWLGAGIAAAAAVVVAQLAFDFPVAKDVMGTVAPAQRYRAAPNGSEDVKLAPAATPGTAVGTVPEADRAVAERTEAQKIAERTNAQVSAERTNAQVAAERTNAQVAAERTNAQVAAERTNAQVAAERTNAQVAAERTNAQVAAERTNAQVAAERTNAQIAAERTNAQIAAERNAQMQKSTNRTVQQ